MTRSFRRRFGSALILGFVAVACDDSRPVGPLRDGAVECEEIGEACHDPGDLYGGEYEACHDIGHENEGKACLDAHARCMALCAAAPPGAGGAPGGHGGEGGDDHGHGGEGGSAHASGGAGDGAAGHAPGGAAGSG